MERKKAHRKPQDQRREEYDASATSSSDEENDVMNALTFIALDNMDECNRKEWIKEKKIGNLAGLEGCQRMARDMVRRERGAGRDAYTPGRGNLLASEVAKNAGLDVGPHGRGDTYQDQQRVVQLCQQKPRGQH